MFKRPTALLLLCCFALLSACANTPRYFWYTSTEQLIERHHYQKAIEQITTETPINQVLLIKVKKLAKKQLEKQAYKIELLVNQKKWGEARDILRQLNFNQPNPASFSTLNLLIHNAQAEEERLINTQLALVEAQLLDIQFIQQDLSNRKYHNRINWFSQNSYLATQKQQLGENLLHLSTQALLVKDYKNAQKTYVKAIELNRELRTGEITQAIHTGLSHQNNKAIDERRDSLIKQLYLAISTLDFDFILKVQEILSHEPFHGAEVEQVLSKATKARIKHSNRLDEIASKQYRKGNISLAVIQWQQALRLTPTKTNILEKLIRAQKVQRKLEKLNSTKKNFPLKR